MVTATTDTGWYHVGPMEIRNRCIAQSGRALASDARGRRFESYYADQPRSLTGAVQWIGLVVISASSRQVGYFSE